MGIKQSRLADGTELTVENVCSVYEERFPKEGQLPKSKRRTDEAEDLDDATVCLRLILSQWPRLVASEAGRKGLLRLSQDPLVAILKSDDLYLSEGGEYFLFLLIGAWAERRVYIETKKKEKERMKMQRQEKRKERKQKQERKKERAESQPKGKTNRRGSKELYEHLGSGAFELASQADSTVLRLSINKSLKKSTKVPMVAEQTPVDEVEDEAVKLLKAMELDEKEDGEKEKEKEKEKEDEFAKKFAIDLRGTAGLFAHMSSGVQKLPIPSPAPVTAEPLQTQLTTPRAQTPRSKSKMPIADPLERRKREQEFRELFMFYLAPLFEYIRFPMMSPYALSLIEKEHIVPALYIMEAYKYHAYAHKKFVSSTFKRNARFKERYPHSKAEWHSTWHGKYIKVSHNGKRVKKAGEPIQPAYLQPQPWYSCAIAKDGYSSGRHYWNILVGGLTPSVGLARKECDMLDKFLGASDKSWAYSHTAFISSGAGGSKSYGEKFHEGDIIGILLDMDKREVGFYKNNRYLGVAFTNLPNVKLYPAVGWRKGFMSFVGVDFLAS